jgi:hypothetical protein
LQVISGYLYHQTVDLVLNLDPLPNRENQLVYAKPLQIYKGIDNKIKLLIKNQDQKLVSILDSIMTFNLIDSATQELIFSRRVLPWVDNRGTAYIILEEMELSDLIAGIYNYSIQFETGENKKRIVYSDDNYNAQGQARVVDGVYPAFKPSLEPKLGPFYNNNPNKNGYSDNNIVYSDVLNVLDRVKSRSILQAVQYYGTNFSGTVEIQGSLSATLTAYPNDWFMIDQLTFDGLTGCQFSSFTGKIGLVRFKITTISGSLDKILYRP